MSVNSKVEICNLALGVLGSQASIKNIDTPEESVEKTFATWYDVIREMAIKEIMPNFAITRSRFAKDLNFISDQDFGYAYAYRKPSTCLRVLGIGNLAEKTKNYSVQGNLILTDVDYQSGLPVRYLVDVTDISAMSPEFKVLFAHYLAQATGMQITQDPEKVALVEQRIPIIKQVVMAMASQEDSPIRVSVSQAQKARRGFATNYIEKK
jgi:hypothetical protein